MKKLLSMLLCVAMAFSLVACGKQELPSATTPAPEPAPEIPVWDDAVTIELSDEKIRVTEGHISAWTELPLIGDDYAGMHNDKVMILLMLITTPRKMASILTATAITSRSSLTSSTAATRAFTAVILMWATA